MSFGFYNAGRKLVCILLSVIFTLSGSLFSHVSAGPLDWVGDAAGAIDLTVSGSHRTRYELLRDQERTDQLFSLRTNILVEAGTNNFRIGGELMDSRAYDPEGDVFGFTQTGQFINVEQFINVIEPVQYYLTGRFENIGADGLDLTIKGGRFTLDFGSGRLFGRAEYGNTVNSFRGGQVLFERENQSLLLFYAQPYDITTDDDNRQQMDAPNQRIDFWGAHYTHSKLRGNINAEAYFYVQQIDFRESGLPPNLIYFTPGVRVWRKRAPGRFDFEVEAAPQFRQHPQGFAYFGHVQVGYEFDHDWRPHAALVFDIASGDGEISTIECQPIPDVSIPGCRLVFGREGTSSFNSYSGRLSDDFGPTGLFRSNSVGLVGPSFGGIGRTNLISPGIQLSAMPYRNFSVEARYRAFWREDPYPDFNSRFFDPANPMIMSIDSQIGQQVDAALSYSLFDGRLQLEVGGAMFFYGNEPNEIRQNRFNPFPACEIVTGLPCNVSLPPLSSRKYFFSALTVSF